jgi:uncharacterized protein (DUF2342 family)
MSAVAITIVCVVAVFASVAAAVTASVILSIRNEQVHRIAFLADNARQDRSVSRMVDANKRAAESTQATNEKLDVIHALVNSNLTAVMQAELDATVRVLALLKEVAELRRAAGHEPSREGLDAITATELRISELRSVLTDRQQA